MNFPTMHENVRTEIAIAATAGGTSDVDGASTDMDGYRNCRFTVVFGAIAANAVTSLQMQHRDSTTGSWEDVGDALDVAADDDNQVFQIDLAVVTKRYVRGQVNRGTANAAIAIALYDKYNAKEMPVDRPATVTSAVETG